MVFSAQEVFMAVLHFVLVCAYGGGHGNPRQYTMYVYVVKELIFQFCTQKDLAEKKNVPVAVYTICIWTLVSNTILGEMDDTR